MPECLQAQRLGTQGVVAMEGGEGFVDALDEVVIDGKRHIVAVEGHRPGTLVAACTAAEEVLFDLPLIEIGRAHV